MRSIGLILGLWLGLVTGLLAQQAPDPPVPAPDPQATPAIVAACQGNLEKLQAAEAADPMALQTPDSAGHTPLMHAIDCKQVAGATWLIDQGVDLAARDRHGYTALEVALQRRLWPVAERLVAKGAPVTTRSARGHSLHCEYIHSLSVELFTAMLDKGADPNGDGDELPLITALSDARVVEKMEALLAHKADPNAGHGSPLEAAVTQGDTAAVKVLLTHGADPNLKPVWEWAMQKKQLELGNLLLDFGAQPAWSGAGLVCAVQYLGRERLMQVMEKLQPKEPEAGADLIWAGLLNAGARSADSGRVRYLVENGLPAKILNANAPLLLVDYASMGQTEAMCQLVDVLPDLPQQSCAQNALLGAIGGLWVPAVTQLLEWQVPAGRQGPGNLLVPSPLQKLCQTLSRTGASGADRFPPEAAAIFDLLLAHGAQVQPGGADAEAMATAINTLNPDMVRHLLQAGADPNAVYGGQSLIEIAVAYLRIGEQYRSTGYWDSRMVIGEILLVLIQGGADVHKRDAAHADDLICLVRSDCYEQVPAFAASGVDFNRPDRQGRFALQEALGFPTFDMARAIYTVSGTPFNRAPGFFFVLVVVLLIALMTRRRARRLRSLGELSPDTRESLAGQLDHDWKAVLRELNAYELPLFGSAYLSYQRWRHFTWVGTAGWALLLPFFAFDPWLRAQPRPAVFSALGITLLLLCGSLSAGHRQLRFVRGSVLFALGAAGYAGWMGWNVIGTLAAPLGATGAVSLFVLGELSVGLCLAAAGLAILHRHRLERYARTALERQKRAGRAPDLKPEVEPTQKWDEADSASPTDAVR